MQPQVLLSHCSVDKNAERFKELNALLDLLQIPTWIDDANIRPGDDVSEKLRNAAAKCSICVFFQTQNALASKNCRDELAAFRYADKPVLIFVAEPGTDVATLGAMFANIKSTDRIDLLVAQLRELLALEEPAHESQAMTVAAQSADMDELKRRLRSIEADIGRLGSRLSGARQFPGQGMIWRRVTDLCAG